MEKLRVLRTGRKLRFWMIGAVLPILVTAILFVAHNSLASSDEEQQPPSLVENPNLPAQIDVRGSTPRGLDTRNLTAVQTRAVASLQSLVGTTLNIRYNGLTATPMFIGNPNGYLTAPSNAPAEQIARDFISRWREVFRFDQTNLNNLKLQSRAVSAEGITVMLFQQQANGLPVYHGDVLVNVNKAGRIMTVGGDSFPRLQVTNAAAINAATAVSNAAASLGVVGFAPQSLGASQVLATYGNLTPEFHNGEKFSGGGVFGDDIVVHKIVFPLGDTGRVAYQFNLVTPQFHGMMWENIVDAQTGEVLRRISLTADFGETGGGLGANRRGTFRPDIQNYLEANNPNGTAQGKVIETVPTTMSGYRGFGRAVKTGTGDNATYTSPTYTADTETVRTAGRGYKYSLIFGRFENPLFFGMAPTTFTQAQLPALLGQVTRGLPDAANPSASSPFGWFYLPTGSGGAQITTKDVNRTTTQAHGYNNTGSDVGTRNLAENSPGGNKLQPFSADLTPLSSPKMLADGRNLTSVYQSRYTEGNNVGVSDDRQNDNEATAGIKGYAVNRQFNAPYYDFYNSYEFGGANATGGGTGATTPVVYPASADPDVYPGAVSLFFLNNLEHDYLYSIGFTEQFWNFQMDNFGKGGAGGDHVVAQVQDGSGTNNANMGTPADGASPRMQMFLFTDDTFRRSDGDFDWDVVAHEQYHGVSNRSAGKGNTSCLGTPLVGESGGMGEGWSDFIADSLSDDDSTGEYVTGEFDKGIRRLPITNYRWSYGSLNGNLLNVRKNTNAETVAPDANPGGTPYAVHATGEVWSATLWDMRELMIMKDPNGVFFDGDRRLGAALGTGASFFIGNRQVKSVDANHPINYRASFGMSNGVTPTVTGSYIKRPGLLAAENAANPQRNGPLANAVVKGGQLADKITLRGLQLAPCNPTFIDMRDSMLAADREITGGENLAIIWRAFSSHGIGTGATSSGKTNGVGQQGSAAVIVEDFAVPADIAACETLGPLAAPTFTLANAAANSVAVTIAPVAGATSYVIARGTSQNGPFTTVATVTGTTYTDNDNGTGLAVGQTYYYQVHAARSANCVGSGDVNSITITLGAALVPAPVFNGIGQIADLQTGTTLDLSWSPATSANPNAVLVYDIYRVTNVAADDDLVVPTFAPTTGNRIAQGITRTSYTDTGLTKGQQYYYIVQARDANNGRIDNLNLGNTVTKLNAPTTNRKSATAPFALENFETAAANNRFTAPLVTTAAPDRSMPVFQRTVGELGGGTNLPNSNGTVAEDGSVDAPNVTSGVMYAPDFDPGNANQGGPSDFYTQITPTLTGAGGLNRSSILEFDHRYETEATFDGNNIEIVLGVPTLSTTTPPNNVSTFDLNDYITDNGYTGNLDGAVEGTVPGSPLLGRRSFSGSESFKHVKAAIGDFAPGGVKNPGGLPVYVRFHTTSDAGTFVDGWYVDNVVINNFDTAVNIESDVQGRPSGDGFVDADDIQQIRRFAVGLDMPFQGTEFQRADGSPRSLLGDGFLDSDDVQQARRYSVGTDGTQAVGGPPTALGRTGGNSKGNENIERAAQVKEFTDPPLIEALRATPAMRIDNQTVAAGQTVVVPVRVDTAGNEFGYTFSISYEPTILTNPVVTIGNSGGDVVAGTNTAGQIGFSVTSFAGGPIAEGTNKILVNVQFTVAGNAPNGTMTPVNFTDMPTRRKASGNDPNVPITQPTYTNGTLTIGAAAPTITRAFRVDNQTTNAGQTIVVPVRVDANGDEFGYTFSLSYDSTKLTNPIVSIGNSGGDVVSNVGTAGQIGFSVTSFAGGPIAAGTNKILVNVRFTVALSTPTGTTPVNFTDTPSRRRASGSDPNVPLTQPTYTNGIITINAATPAAARALRLSNYTSTRGSTITIPVFVDTIGDEFGYTFSISYETAFLTNPVVTIGNSGGDVVAGTNTPGQIGFSVTAFPGGPIAAGTNKILVNVQFTVTNTAPLNTTTPLNFTDMPARRKASGNDPNIMLTQPTYTNGSVRILAPTSAGAMITGRVLNGKQGRGIAGVMVSLNDGAGGTRTVLTNSSGYYRFGNVATGRTCIISARAKHHTFEPSSQIINVTQDLARVDFTTR